MEVDLGNALAVVDSSLSQLSRTPVQFRTCVEDVAQQIAGVVAAVQSHDITRQQIWLRISQNRRDNVPCLPVPDHDRAVIRCRRQSCPVRVPSCVTVETRYAQLTFSCVFKSVTHEPSPRATRLPSGLNSARIFRPCRQGFPAVVMSQIFN